MKRGQSCITNVLPFNSEGPYHHHYGCSHSESLVGIFPLRGVRANQLDVFLVPITVSMTK